MPVITIPTADPRTSGSAFMPELSNAFQEIEGSFSDSIALDVGAYINWDTPTGSSGYGFRDNAGTMQVKNLAGSWVNIPTSGTTAWTAAGSDIYFNTGNVGIGDTSPDHKLDVAGNIGMDVGGYLNFGDIDGTSGYGFHDNGGTMQVKNSGGSWVNIPTSSTSQWTTTGSDIYYNTGLVGVGTTTPAAYVHVKGANISNRGQLSLESTDFSQLTLWNGTTALVSNYYHDISANISYLGTRTAGGQLQVVTAAGANAVRINASGDMVVGATTASAKLHSLSATEQLRLGYDASNYTSFTVSSAGNLTAAPSGGTLAVTGILTSTSFSTGALVATSATIPLVIGGTGTTSTLSLRATSGVGITGADIIFQVGNNGATEAMRIGNNANVGIGVAPSSTLDRIILATRNQSSIQTEISVTNNASTGNAAGAGFRAVADVAHLQFFSWASSRTSNRFGVAIGGYNEVIAVAGNGIIFGTFNNTPVIFGQNQAQRMTLDSVGFGIGIATPLKPLDVFSDSGGQMRLTYAFNSVFADFTVGSGGNLAIEPTGDLILNATGKDILPATNYDQNLGALAKKYLTIHAAELWVETLVAQDTIATIGGRILVGPTTTLILDLTSGATTIDVKHNQMASGDRVYMEAAGKVEFMAVTSAPTTITGGFRYSVTRNLDGTGANAWNAGDAVFNTGTTGDGFIDLYSLRGVKSSSHVGPTIVGNVRNSATYNDWSEAWAVGNLNGLYGYGADTYGVGLGKYIAGVAHITIDPTNGYRIFSGLSTVVGSWDNAGVITIGQVAASQDNILISAGALAIRNNTTTRISLAADGSGFLANSLIAWDASGNLTVTGNATIGGFSIGADYIRDAANSFGLASTVTVGDDVRFWAGNTFANRATAPFRVTEAGALVATSATITGAITATSGSITGTFAVSGGALTAGGGNAVLDNNGIQVISSSAFAGARAYSNVASLGGATLSAFYDANDTAFHTAWLQSNAIASKDSSLNLAAFAPTGQNSDLGLFCYVNSVFKAGMGIDAGSGITLHAGSAGDIRLSVDLSGVFQIWNGSAMKTVSFGANDSGGVGFRMMRIAN